MRFCVMILVQCVVVEVAVGSKAQSVNQSILSMSITTSNTEGYIFGSGMETLDTMDDADETMTDVMISTLSTARLSSFLNTQSTSNFVTPIVGASSYIATSSSSRTNFTTGVNPVRPRSMDTVSTNPNNSSTANPTVVTTVSNSECSDRIITTGFGIGWIIGFVIGVLVTIVTETALCLCWRKKKTYTYPSEQTGEYIEMSSKVLQQHSAESPEDNHESSSDINKPLIQ